MNTTKFDHMQVVTFKDKQYTITAKRWFQPSGFRPDAYMVDYLLDPEPEYEHDDQIWVFEGNISC